MIQACKAAQQKKSKFFFQIKEKQMPQIYRPKIREARDPFLKIAKQNIQLIVPDKTMPVAPIAHPLKCEMTRYAK